MQANDGRFEYEEATQNWEGREDSPEYRDEWTRTEILGHEPFDPLDRFLSPAPEIPF